MVCGILNISVQGVVNRPVRPALTLKKRNIKKPPILWGNKRHFWCRGYYVDTVGKIDPFTGEPVEKRRKNNKYYKFLLG